MNLQFVQSIVNMRGQVQYLAVSMPLTYDGTLFSQKRCIAHCIIDQYLSDRLTDSVKVKQYHQNPNLNYFHTVRQWYSGRSAQFWNCPDCFWFHLNNSKSPMAGLYKLFHPAILDGRTRTWSKLEKHRKHEKHQPRDFTSMIKTIKHCISVNQMNQNTLFYWIDGEGCKIITNALE